MEAVAFGHLRLEILTIGFGEALNVLERNRETFLDLFEDREVVTLLNRRDHRTVNVSGSAKLVSVLG